jgi:glyoxylase-like metal-dependent hydrolase (beta-lactamase superfamily II)
VADRERRHAKNVAGPWFVDDSCIDCDASRQCAPNLFADVGGQTVVIKQPETEDERRLAMRALLLCPTASIGVDGPKPDPAGLFPWEIERGVFLAGYNSADSFGANSFFVERAEGNLLIDSPRFVRPLVRELEARGGLSAILLTHQDDVADADRYAQHFGAKVFIHEADARGAPFATELLRGLEPVELRPGLIAFPVPGHTRGSVMFLLEDTFLFSGDSLYFSRERRALSAFRSACWYSWTEQTRSLARLSERVEFEWVLPGHGDRHRAEKDRMKRWLRELVARMSSNDRTLADDDW